MYSPPLVSYPLVSPNLTYGISIPNEQEVMYEMSIGVMIRPLSLYEDSKEVNTNIEIPPAINPNNNSFDFQDIISEMHLHSPKDEGEMDLEPKHPPIEITTHSSRTSVKLKSSDSAEKRARILFLQSI